MKKFIIDNTEYTVTACTAVAVHDDETMSRQDALLVENTAESGEKFSFVVFTYPMPETVKDFEEMSEDYYAWDSDYEVLETVEIC